MHAYINKPEMAGRFYTALEKLSYCPIQGVDGMNLIMHFAGVLVETCLIYDQPDVAIEASMHKLSQSIGCEPRQGDFGAEVLPPAHMIDSETERGRTAARIFLEDWMESTEEFNDLILNIIQSVFIRWEDDGIHRDESFRMLCECTKLAMAFEISAQELCDIVIERQVAREGWSLGDCISALSAVAGRRLAQSLNAQTCMVFKGSDIPANLDQIVYVMTKEAIRLGVPAGSDWRFGLAANDMPINAPVELIRKMEPYANKFFDVVNLQERYYVHAVCLAKAAGRMVAVASGGELPEIEPAIAKPLAMSAMTESYKFVCIDHNILSAGQ